MFGKFIVVIYGKEMDVNFIDWRSLAACINEDPEIFWPRWTGDPSKSRALKICQGCVVQSECLAYAQKIRAPGGVWGGKLFAANYRERKGDYE